jgi:hypothetical protein
MGVLVRAVVLPYRFQTSRIFQANEKNEKQIFEANAKMRKRTVRFNPVCQKLGCRNHPQCGLNKPAGQVCLPVKARTWASDKEVGVRRISLLQTTLALFRQARKSCSIFKLFHAVSYV